MSKMKKGKGSGGTQTTSGGKDATTLEEERDPHPEDLMELPAEIEKIAIEASLPEIK